MLPNNPADNDVTKCGAKLNRDVTAYCGRHPILFASRCPKHNGRTQQQRQLDRYGLYIRREGVINKVYSLVDNKQVPKKEVASLDLSIKKEYKGLINQVDIIPTDNYIPDKSAEEVAAAYGDIEARRRIIQVNPEDSPNQKALTFYGASTEIVKANLENVPVRRKYLAKGNRERQIHDLLYNEEQINPREELAILQSMLQDLIDKPDDLSANYKILLIKEIGKLIKVIKEIEEGRKATLTMQNVKMTLIKVVHIIKKYIPNPDDQKKAAEEIMMIATQISVSEGGSNG